MSAENTVVSLTPAVFHIPDEVNEVSRTYGVNPIVPRGPKFRPILERVRGGIVEALGATQYEAVLLTGSGSTAMASVIGSCLHPKEKLLVVRNGAYGERILGYARAIGQEVVDLEFPYGHRPDLALVEEKLRECDAVAMVHGGTSTCTLNPAREVGEIAKRLGKKFIMDGISSLFLEEIDLDAWNIAAVMGSANKGLQSQPNLSFALLRRDLIDEMAGFASRTPNLELYKAWEAQSRGSHPYTIDPLSVLQADAALVALKKQGGVKGRHAEHTARATLLRQGYEALGLQIARFEGQPLQSIGTMLALPEGKNYDMLSESLATRAVKGHVFEIYSAQGKLSGEFFRIFNMGHYPMHVYEIFLEALAETLKN